MVNEEPHMNIELLSKFLLGETSREEQLYVIEWLEADPANQKELDKLEEVWIKTGELKPPPLPVDMPMAWTKLESRIDEHDSKVKTKKRVLNPIMYAAASIAFIVLVFNILKPTTLPFDPVIVANISDMAQTDTLPDGSIVTLNKNSKLTYLSSSDDPHRQMILEGEAFFHVVRDTLRPFIIKAGMGGVRVLGTSFNVRVTNITDVTVDVKTGLVELFYPVTTSNDTLRLKLKAGESGMLSHQQSQLLNNQASPSSLFWINNTLTFRNKPLKDVFEVLSQCYAVNIVCDDNNINYTNLSTTFSGKEVNEVLDVIAATFDISYKQEGNTYHFYRP